jgi:Protein of unknown function (DUF4230)
MTTYNNLKPIVQGFIDKLVDKLILIGLAAIAILLLGWWGLNLLPQPVTVNTTADVTSLIISGVRNLSDFNTASTNSKATIVVEQDKKIFGVPIGNTNLVYEGVATISAGIDIKELKVVKLDNAQHFIQISLPSPYINEVNLNVNRSSILANYRQWFGDKVDTELYEIAQKKVTLKIKEEACANNILEEANNNAKVLVNNIFTKAGFKTIQIDTQAPQSNACSVA